MFQPDFKVQYWIKENLGVETEEEMEDILYTLENMKMPQSMVIGSDFIEDVDEGSDFVEGILNDIINRDYTLFNKNMVNKPSISTEGYIEEA